MISKIDIVETKLTEMFYYQQEKDMIQTQIEKINHEMENLKSPNLSGQHGNPEEKDSKIIRLSEKKKPLEKSKAECDLKYHTLFNSLYLYELDQNEMEFLEKIYKDKKRLDIVAQEMYFTGKAYVSRKKNKLLEKLSYHI